VPSPEWNPTIRELENSIAQILFELDQGSLRLHRRNLFPKDSQSHRVDDFQLAEGSHEPIPVRRLHGARRRR
jgi:hypothetical protein